MSGKNDMVLLRRTSILDFKILQICQKVWKYWKIWRCKFIFLIMTLQKPKKSLKHRLELRKVHQNSWNTFECACLPQERQEKQWTNWHNKTFPDCFNKVLPSSVIYIDLRQFPLFSLYQDTAKNIDLNPVSKRIGNY